MKRTRKGRLARRALSLLFALTLLWECGALTPKARAADGVDVRLRAHVNGEARVTVSSEAANVTYTLTITSDSGAPRLRECVWSAYAPPSPLTEEELDALLSGVADSLRNLEIAAEP